MESLDKINEIMSNMNDSSNKELIFCMDYLSLDFERTKNAILKLTEHLDKTEILYNKVLKEYQKRNAGFTNDK